MARRHFRQRLLRWYDRNHRKLPWRGETDPYRILLSEIMLQQTRVAVVEERYRLFLAQFPSIERLALHPGRTSPAMAVVRGMATGFDIALKGPGGEPVDFVNDDHADRFFS